MPNSWINKINESNSRIHKETTISEALSAAKLGDASARTFLWMAWQAYNPFRVYNVKRVPVTKGYTDRCNNFEIFGQLLSELHDRHVTGNAALSMIEQCSLEFDSDVWNDLLRPTILKDLRIGATVKTFNKVLKGTEFEIPLFESQLATDSEKHPKKLIGKKILEPKLDGVRALAIIQMSKMEPPKVQIFSRNGKPLDNFPHIESQLTDCLALDSRAGKWQEYSYSAYVIDGEIVSTNFQALMKQAQRKTDIDTSDAVFTIFDIIPLEKFKLGKWEASQATRTNYWLGPIREAVNASCPSLHIISGLEVDLDTTDGQSQMRRYAQDQVDMGYEGIMIKDPKAPYTCKRGTAWMKWKPTITVDLEIIGFVEGTGRNKGRLGAFVCRGLDDGREITTNVGGGISDNDRTNFWNDRESLRGWIVEIKADAVTQNQDGTYSLRFPRYVRFRGFEPGEKL